MSLTPNPMELTTAATDAGLGVMCLALFVWLRRFRVDAPWKKQVWSAVFALLGVSSFLGTVAHGLDLNPIVRSRIWIPLYLSLGWCVSLFVVGAMTDALGEAAARRSVPWMLAAGFLCFVVARQVDRFVVFLAYEGVAMLAALAIYGRSWRRGAQPGAARVTVGIALTLAAAGLQQSHIVVTIGVPFDHNGLFHIAQGAAMLLMWTGLRADLLARAAGVSGADRRRSTRGRPSERP